MKNIFFLAKGLEIKSILFFLVGLFLFLLPWQSRWIFSPAFLNGGFWEYGTKSLYGTEILLWVIFLLSGVNWYCHSERSHSGVEESLKVSSQKKFKGFLHARADTQSGGHSLPELVRNDKLVLIFGLLVLFLLVLSIFQSSNQELSLYFILRIGEGIGLCLVISQINFSINKLITPLWIGGVIQGILAIVQFFNQYIGANKWFGLATHHGGQLGAGVIETISGRWLRAYGSFGWPNSLGIYLAVVWIVGFILYLQLQNKTYWAIIFGGQLLILSGLILSFSRGAWIAAGIGILFLIILVVRFSVGARGPSPLPLGNKKSFVMTPLIGSIVLTIFFIILLWPLFTTRFNATTRLEERSVSERIGQYVQAKSVITSNVWFGVGPGAYTFYLFKLNPTLKVWDFQPVHNIYFLELAEMGTLFLGLSIFIFSYFMWYIWKKNPLFLSIAVVLLVAGLFDHWLWSMYGGQMLWWSVMGLALKKLSYNPSI